MKPTDSTASQSFLSSIMEVLDDSTRERLDQPISLDKLTKALESLEKNKTMGSDGSVRLDWPGVQQYASGRKDASLRGATIRGNKGQQVKASLYMDNATVFC
eukprot:g19333.t1